MRVACAEFVVHTHVRFAVRRYALVGAQGLLRKNFGFFEPSFALPHPPPEAVVWNISPLHKHNRGFVSLSNDVQALHRFVKSLHLPHVLLINSPFTTTRRPDSTVSFFGSSISNTHVRNMQRVVPTLVNDASIAVLDIFDAVASWRTAHPRFVPACQNQDRHLTCNLTNWLPVATERGVERLSVEAASWSLRADARMITAPAYLELAAALASAARLVERTRHASSIASTPAPRAGGKPSDIARGGSRGVWMSPEASLPRPHLHICSE